MYPTLHSQGRDERKAIPAKHGRSFSHPFPSFLGRKSEKRAQVKNKINVDSTDDDDSTSDGYPTRAPNIASRSRSVSVKKEPMIGKCMTCNSTVRWPRALKVFRCTVCLTVNDLEPYHQVRPSPRQTVGQASHPPLTVPVKAVPLSLERTRAIVDQCLRDYLSARQHDIDTATYGPSRSKSDRTMAPEDSSHAQASSNGLYERISSDSKHSPQDLPHDDEVLHTLHHVGDLAESPRKDSQTAVEPSDGSEQDDGSKPRRSRDTVFRPVESYITSSLTDCATLNSSFLAVAPGLQRAATEGTPVRSSPKKHVSTPQDGDHTLPKVEVDAKTLLLGDIAENGSWWTGERPPSRSFRLSNRTRSPGSWRGTVGLRSPHLNWTEIASWYRCLLHAGESWREEWRTLQQEQPSSTLPGPTTGTKMLEDSAAEIEEDLFKSRNHLQRVLLKATENLLKRPGRPLRHPEDCRFLFILLANPLLAANSPSMPRKQNMDQRTGPGKHSGIIKRLLGLLAHVPDEVHRFFVSWFSRFSEGQFQQLADLIGGFVTYRLTRPFQKRELVNPADGLVPSFADSGIRHASQLHAALGRGQSTSSKAVDSSSSSKPQLANYADDWQVRASARVMALLFAANGGHFSKRRESMPNESRSHSVGSTARHSAHAHGQLIPISNFYNSMLDYADLVADFENWEAGHGGFSFCQYPFFLSIYAKIYLLETEARRQMEIKAREAFFDSILSNKAVSQYLVLKVRRDCLVDDSLRRIGEAVGSGQGDIKKGLRIDFIGEEGVDAGGLRKEWFLLLIREVFDEAHGLFVYDEDSRFCYFNSHCFESSEQYFLVGVVTGLAIYNSTILDIAFPPFVFKKLLASTPISGNTTTTLPRPAFGYTLEDLAELHPALAHGLRQLLDYNGDVQETFCRDFVVEEDRYGEHIQVPLLPGGEKQAVTNSNRREYVQAYIHYLLDTSVSRQYEPFKRGFFTVCGGNALSLFRPEEIELLIRGSDAPLDIDSLRAVAIYEGCLTGPTVARQDCRVAWFWEAFEAASPVDQRKLLAFVTGSDRIPAMGATNLIIKIQLLDNVHAARKPSRGPDGCATIQDQQQQQHQHQQGSDRFPTARTCFNTLILHPYESKEQLEGKLWMAVRESEGFGLK